MDGPVEIHPRFQEELPAGKLPGAAFSGVTPISQQPDTIKVTNVHPSGGPGIGAAGLVMAGAAKAERGFFDIINNNKVIIVLIVFAVVVIAILAYFVWYREEPEKQSAHLLPNLYSRQTLQSQPQYCQGVQCPVTTQPSVQPQPQQTPQPSQTSTRPTNAVEHAQLVSIVMRGRTPGMKSDADIIHMMTPVDNVADSGAEVEEIEDNNTEANASKTDANGSADNVVSVD